VTSAGTFSAGALFDVVTDVFVAVPDELELVPGAEGDAEPDPDAAAVGSAEELSVDAD
jgi:hypothetical protein